MIMQFSFKNILAIRPDRDVIGKQKNPRKRKMKRESSSLPSPGGADHIKYVFS